MMRNELLTPEIAQSVDSPSTRSNYSTVKTPDSLAAPGDWGNIEYDM